MKEKLILSRFRRMPDAFYFVEKGCGEDRMPVSKAVFEKRLSNPEAAASFHEVIEELPDSDHWSANSTLIMIITHGGGGRSVEIDFESVGQWEHFALPDWLIPIER